MSVSASSAVADFFDAFEQASESMRPPRMPLPVPPAREPDPATPAREADEE